MTLFDQFKNISGLANLFKDADRFKDEFARLQSELARERIEAETGGGAVRAVVSGAMRVVSIEVNPALIASLVNAENEEDRHLAEELIAGAVNAALNKAKMHVSEEMSRKAQEMGLPLPPGADLSQLLGPAGGGEAG